MLRDYYHIDTSDNFQTFEFESIGYQGKITKVVLYTKLDGEGIYNLGFGDKDPLTGFVSDVIVTNNGDSQKVLATVAVTLYTFTNNHPGAIVIATGSSKARTRLYRMGITNNLEEIEKDFIVFGLSENGWEPFGKNITYDAFLVRRKL